MGAKIGVLLNCGQQSQFSKVRREFDAGRVNLDPPMTCADWPVPGNLTLLHTQTAYTRKPLHRAYLAVQQWIGDNLGPTDWGWQYRDGMLVPLTTDRPVAPTRVLRIVSCGCNTGCRKTCGCPIAGLYCSPIVQLLQWTHMHNIHALAVSQDSDNASYRCECYNSCHVSVLNFVCALLRSFFLLFVSISIIYAYAH